MKKIFRVVLCLCLCACLSSCKTDQRNYSADYESDYDDGYRAGYEDGLWDGAYECKEDFANAFRDQYFDVEHATKNGRELHPEEAIMVLNDYLDGEHVSDYELETAIETITDFYLNWQEVIANIEDLDVDIDFD